MIRVINLSQIEIDGSDAGDIVSVAQTHPELLPQIAIELKAYESHLIQSANQQANMATIAALKAELAPEIAEITPALMEAGLLAWGNRATIADPGEVLPFVLQLNQAAIEPRSVTQCDRIKGLFVTICQRSGVVPTPDEAQAMQSILDVGPPSTGPIASKYLSFEPWMQPTGGA
jgi:hypothetical protein